MACWRGSFLIGRTGGHRWFHEESPESGSRRAVKVGSRGGSLHAAFAAGVEDSQQVEVDVHDRHGRRIVDTSRPSPTAISALAYGDESLRT